jgi:hypothetical protein
MGMTFRTRIRLSFMASALLLIGAAPAADPPPPTSEETPGETDWRTGVAQHTGAGKPAKAIAICEAQKVRPATPDAQARKTCAMAYLALGDRLHVIGASARARSYWDYASKLDLELMDDEDFLVRLAPPLAPPAPTPPPVAAPSPIPVPGPGAPQQPVKPAGTWPPTIKKAKSGPVLPDGPRADRNFYMGLGAGYDGLASIHIGWCHAERVLLEVSTGLIFPVLDSRVRILGPRRELTTFLGIGMTTPLGDEDLFGLDLPTYESLYALGETFHVEGGLSWAVSQKVEVSGAAVFVTSLDANSTNQIVFFPQFGAQVSYGF